MLNKSEKLTPDEIIDIFNSDLKIKGFELSDYDHDYIWYENENYFLVDIKNWIFYPHFLTRVIEAINRKYSDNGCNGYSIRLLEIGSQLLKDDKPLDTYWSEPDESKILVIRKYLERVG